MEIFKKVIYFFEKRYWVFLFLIVLIAYGQTLVMLPWQDDNALFFKLANIEGRAGYLGAGPFGEGAYKYTAFLYLPIYLLFNFRTEFYFAYTLVLYFLAKKIQQIIFSLFLRVTRRKNWAVYLTAILFAPGTFFHEMSHFLSALFLLVPVGHLRLLPEVREDEIKLGSVGIGTLTILVVIHLARDYKLIKNVWTVVLLGYVVFEIGNTMFASKKDLEGALGLLIFIILVYLLTLLLGINVDFSFLGDILTSSYIKDLLVTATVFLVFPLVIDTVIITILRFI